MLQSQYRGFGAAEHLFLTSSEEALGAFAPHLQPAVGIRGYDPEPRALQQSGRKRNGTGRSHRKLILP